MDASLLSMSFQDIFLIIFWNIFILVLYDVSILLKKKVKGKPLHVLNRNKSVV